VTGRITVDGDRSPTLLHLENVKIEFLGVGAVSLAINIASGNVDPEGKFTYKNVWPGEYRVWFSGLAPDTYLKEARLGDRDVLTGTVLITEPLTSELKIVLGAEGGAVAGVVTAAQGAAVSGKQVVLVPDEPTNRPDLYKTAITDRNGHYSIRGIAPGDYRLYAWDRLESYRYFDPDFVRAFEMEGTIVHVSDTTPITANVTLIR
jgi:hypothetical protein